MPFSLCEKSLCPTMGRKPAATTAKIYGTGPSRLLLAGPNREALGSSCGGIASEALGLMQHHHHSTAYAAPLPTSYSASAVTRARVRHGSQPGPLASSNPQPHQQRSSSSPGANQSASSPSSSSTSPDNSWLAMRSPRVWGYDSEDSALFEFPGAVILEEAVPEEPQVFLV